MSQRYLDKDFGRRLKDRAPSAGSRGESERRGAAARRESVELVQLLLGRGAQIDAQGGYHGSALIGAAQYGNLEILKLLINAKANLDLRGRYGTALAVARDKQHDDVVEVHLAAGATEWRPNNKELDRQFGLRF
ncbi:hypothetical protein N7523_004281 [Penicillium sp. IBT 18751x]|nr:hypothetical protein N7523_004281 [Penicillium sp. IBT 18751x]